MMNHSKNSPQMQTLCAGTFTRPVAAETCMRTDVGAGTDAVLWMTPLCALITGKHVRGLNGHPEGVS